jgi:hypothetical protein
MKNVLLATNEPTDSQINRLLDACNREVISKMKKAEKKLQLEFKKSFSLAQKTFNK